MCNSLAQAGANVDVTSTKAAAVDPAGGTIADGTYTLTKILVHNAKLPEGSKLTTAGPVTIDVTLPTANSVAQDTKGGNVSRTTTTLTTSGTTVTTTPTCVYPTPDGGTPSPKTVPYTATATTFTQFTTPQAGTTVETVFTKK